MTKNNKQSGFTLIEAMVALVILSTALIPALYLSNLAVNSAFSIRDNMIGANLAQEGLEVVRNIRDTNWFNNLPFDSGLNDGSYQVEWNSESLLSLSGNPALKVDNGLYNYSTGTATIFKRSIIITKMSSVELKVVSQVSWPTRGNQTKTIQAEVHLFNWK